MSINPIKTFSPFIQPQAAPAALTETESKTDQLKSLIPAEIPLEKDRMKVPQTDYELFKDLNPDTNELEEGIFLKSPYPAVPAMKWEGLEELDYAEKIGLQRSEISCGKKHAIVNRYIGYFPKDCAAEDNYRIKGSHQCMGVFDSEGKLISGSWKYKQQGLGFDLQGDFTYETTETEQKILCKGVYTFSNNHFRGTFVVTRKLNEAFFYCTQENEEAEETRTIEGITYKGFFKDDRLISGSITYPDGKILKGLWSFETTIREATAIHCHGSFLNQGYQGCFIHYARSAVDSNLQPDLNRALEWGKQTQKIGRVNNPSTQVLEGQFFSIKPDNNIPSFITIYKPEKTSYRWTMHGRYYLTYEDAIQKKREAHL